MPIISDGVAYDELASDPGSPAEGQVWFNTTEKKYKCYRDGQVEEYTSVFGGMYKQVSDDSERSTTAQSFQQAIRLTTDSCPANGTYYIGWYAELKTDIVPAIIRVRVQVDGSDVCFNDVALSVDATVDLPYSGFHWLALGTGTHTIDMDWYAYTDGMEAAIRRTRLVFWRVS